MLKLRRGIVVAVDPLTVEVGGDRRRAWAEPGLVGAALEGDEVIVNVEALDLGLGSGGFDIVHVNLTRGLEFEGGADGSHVMKLNYSSLQHPVEPVETTSPDDDRAIASPPAMPVLVLPLHGHLAPAAWAAARARDGLRIGYVQSAGGALPGSLSRDVPELRNRGLLCAHLSAGACYGGEKEAISVAGGLDAAARSLEWDAAIVGPGPGILGSASRLGHGGVAALENAHAALALGLPTMISPRLSSSDPRPRHRGLSHHTRTVLELLLEPVTVAAPELAAGQTGQAGAVSALEGMREKLAPAIGSRHDLAMYPVDLDAYAASGLPTSTMGRPLAEDPLFFAAPLAAGAMLAAAVGAAR